MKDYYLKLGITEETVNYDYIKKKKRSEEEKDAFIREKYEDRMKSIRYKQEIAESQGKQDRLEELKLEAEEVTNAYEKIKVLNLRQNLDGKGANTQNETVNTKETAFDVLRINRRLFFEHRVTDEQLDKRIEKRVEEYMNYYQKLLEQLDNDELKQRDKYFKERSKILTQMDKIKHAGELLKTAERRKSYIAKIQKREEENKESIRQQQIKEKYAHTPETELTLINGRNYSDTRLSNEVITRIAQKSTRECFCPDTANRKLRIAETAQINFRIGSMMYPSTINEYRITREIDGKEKVDIVYSEISIFDLSIDERTGEPINPDYYNCIVNQLLAEDVIEGAVKYNGGFIGGVKKDQNGNYYITLEKKEKKILLSPREQEQLKAIKIMEKRNNEKMRPKEGEIR